MSSSLKICHLPRNSWTQREWLSSIVCPPSWPWSHGHPDWLLCHEALQDDGSWDHRLDQNLQTGLGDWTSATVFGHVSQLEAFVIDSLGNTGSGDGGEVSFPSVSSNDRWSGRRKCCLFLESHVLILFTALGNSRASGWKGNIFVKSWEVRRMDLTELPSPNSSWVWMTFQ
jgi:hypothetical protein